MHLTVYEQGEIFYFAFLFGIILGVFYDFFRFLRYLGFNSKSAVIVWDIVFMSACSVLCFLFAQVTVNGKLRFFTLFAHFCGMISYRYSFGLLSGAVFAFVEKILIKIKTMLTAIIGFVQNVFLKVYSSINSILDKNDEDFEKKSEFVKKFQTNLK